MLHAEITPNLAGFTLRGDIEDLSQLVEAIYQMTVTPEGQKNEHETLHLMALAAAYEVRHALQGDRGVALADNGVNNEIKKLHKTLLPNQNVYFVTRLDAITAGFVAAVFEHMLFPSRLWHYTRARAALQQYQAAVMSALQPVLSEQSYRKVERRVLDFPYHYRKDYCLQYLEEQTAKYLRMNKEKRLKALPGTLTRVLEMGDPYRQTVQDVKEAAAYYGCTAKQIQLSKSWEYPDDFEW